MPSGYRILRFVSDAWRTLRKCEGLPDGEPAAGPGGCRACAAEPGRAAGPRGECSDTGVSLVPYRVVGYGTDMPSTKKRITVYLDDDAYARVERFCEATGESRAAAVAGLIEAATPMLERIVDLAGALKSAPDDVRATFEGAADQLQGRYDSITAEAEDFWKVLESLAQGDGPRPVTRGPE